jgi:hypothetical protein
MLGELKWNESAGVFFSAKNLGAFFLNGGISVLVVRKFVGTPDYPSGIPDMHTIHDPMISMS